MHGLRPPSATQLYPTHSYYREISEQQREAALARGLPSRNFFPHRFYYLPKCGPDAFKLGQRLFGLRDVNACWEVVLYALPPVADEFPDDLFFDDDLIWHRQQFGKPGQVATANLYLRGKALYTTVHISDLIQRISKRREHKTRIENRFKGWHYMLLNSIANFAHEKGLRDIYTPTSELAMQNTDRRRTVKAELFQRIYDRNVSRFFKVEKKDSWWRIGVSENRNRIVIAEKGRETNPSEKTICLCHDIERGQGYIGMDPALVERAERDGFASLKEMRTIEIDHGLPATYNVVGRILPEVRAWLEREEVCIAFHSFDHDLQNEQQLSACREIDYRIKGYRVPRSKLTSELTPDRLCFHNFEWISSSVSSLGLKNPVMRDRIVWIPVRFDDFPLYGGLSYREWERQALDHLERNDFVAFSLHDCYATCGCLTTETFWPGSKGWGVSGLWTR